MRKGRVKSRGMTPALRAILREHRSLDMHFIAKAAALGKQREKATPAKPAARAEQDVKPISRAAWADGGCGHRRGVGRCGSAADAGCRAGVVR